MVSRNFSTGGNSDLGQSKKAIQLYFINLLIMIFYYTCGKVTGLLVIYVLILND